MTHINNFLKNNKHYLQVAVGAIMVSFSAVFVKLSSAAPTIDAFYRLGLGGLILLIIALIRRDSLIASKRAFYTASAAGFLFAADLTFWHQSILYIGPGLATIIINLQVFILTLAGYFYYKETLTKKFLVALPLAFLGMYLMVGYEWKHYSGDFHLGIGLAFIATCFYTSYIFTIRSTGSLKTKYKPVMNLAIVSLAGAALAGMIAFFQGEHFVLQNTQDWLWLLLYGVFGQVLGWLLISMGLPNIKLGIAGFLLLFQPALAFVWGITIFREYPPMVEIIGALITLIAIYLSSTAKS